MSKINESYKWYLGMWLVLWWRTKQENGNGKVMWISRGWVVSFSSMYISHGCCNKLPQIWSLKNNKNLFFHSSASQVLNIKELASPHPFRGFRRDSTPCLFRLLVSVGIPFSWLFQSCLFFLFLTSSTLCTFSSLFFSSSV